MSPDMICTDGSHTAADEARVIAEMWRYGVTGEIRYCDVCRGYYAEGHQGYHDHERRFGGAAGANPADAATGCSTQPAATCGRPVRIRRLH